MLKGTLKFYDEQKKYGFIVPENSRGNDDVFFHISNVPGKKISHKDKGKAVEYVLEVSQKNNRPEGHKVRVL